MSEIVHSERAHSRIGASSSKRWFACPASVPLSEGVETTTSSFAEEGTAAHELAEYCLVNDLDAVHGVGLEFNGFRVTTEMAEAVQVYLDVIRETANDDCDVMIEEKFHLGWIHADLFGSNDCCIVDLENRKLTVLDYKHGRGVAVEAKDNPQLLYYALGAREGYADIHEVELVIVQPRCDHPEGPIRTWKIDTDKLDWFENELKARVDRVINAEQAFKAGHDVYHFAAAGDHCKFCPASGFCKKLRDKSYEVAQVAFKDETVNPPSPEDLTPDQLTKVLTQGKILEEWLKSVKAYAYDQANKGNPPTGFKLVKSKSNRIWTDEEEAREYLEMMDCKEDQMYTKKFLSPAQAEKIVGKGNVDHLTTKPDKGTQLVPESDKRPAVQTAVEMFDL